MKWNCYDLFDHYNTEKNGVPALKEQPIRTDAVLERVQAQTAAHSQPLATDIEGHQRGHQHIEFSQRQHIPHIELRFADLQAIHDQLALRMVV